jgi:endonuclease-3 related protein
VKPTAQEEALRTYYEALFTSWGEQHWWPARTRFEVIVGAYLTQNTSWTNVERALQRLRAAGRLNLEGIRSAELAELESLIHSAGYFRQKAKRLKIFVAFLDHNYDGSLRRMFAQPTDKLRQELLALNGVGPETADSILLYAGQHPVFVVDAYTRRVLERHGILASNTPYETIRKRFERALVPLGLGPASKPDLGTARSPHPPSPLSRAKRSPITQIYNQMHGLIVAVGKDHCLKSQPDCAQCPLRNFLLKQS